jgi:DNA primase/hydrogenase maturation factor
MTATLDDRIPHILESVDLVELVTRYGGTQAGSERGGSVTFHCPNPAHADTTPSFTVNVNRQTWKCWSQCEAAGDAIDLLLFLNVAGTKAQAIEMLANESGMSRPEPVKTPRPVSGRAAPPKVVATYDYTDERGEVLYKINRYEPGRDGKSKSFGQFSPDGNGGWKPGLNGQARPPYKLPDVVSHMAKGDGFWVFIVEGEKCVEALADLGIVATCNSQGAGQFTAEHADWFKGAYGVAVLPDNDARGQAHAVTVATLTSGVADHVRIVELPGLPDKGDVADWIATGGDRKALKALLDATPDWTPDQEQADPPNPQPLVEAVATEASGAQDDGANAEGWGPAVAVDPVANVPAFPVEVLPDWVREYVSSQARATQTPIDLASLLAITVIGSTAAGRIDIQIKQGWSETLNLYMVPVLESGERKSPVFRATTAPLFEFEQELVEAAMPEIRAARTIKAEADQRAANAIKESAKAKAEDRMVMRGLAVEAQEEAANLPNPVEPRLLVDDVTSERLVTILDEQGGNIALFSEEGGAFAAMTGRYSGKSNGAPSADMDVWIKAYDGARIRVDRVGRAPDYVETPTLSLALTVQKVVLQGLMAETEMRGRGMLARPCYSVPTSTVGFRDTRAEAVPPALQDRWSQNVRTMARTFRQEHGTVTLSAEALEVLNVYGDSLEPRVKRTGDLVTIRDWVLKHAGRVARIAAGIHLAEHFQDGWSEPVSADVMRRAVRIGEYLLIHALVAFDIMGADDSLERLSYLLHFLSEREDTFTEKPFTNRDLLYATNRSRFKNKDVMQQTIQQAIDFGWIREVESPTKTHKTKRYELRPDFAVTLATVTTVQEQSPLTVASVATVAQVPNPRESQVMQQTNEFPAFSDASMGTPPIDAEMWERWSTEMQGWDGNDPRWDRVDPYISGAIERTGSADFDSFNSDELAGLFDIFEGARA